MAARTLEQILSELGTVYDPQIQSIQAKQQDIPNQVKQEEQGLQAKQQTAFGDILNGARRRGTGVAFGGIPLQEQAKYTADNYLPALANLHTAAKQQATSLQDAINQIYERRNTQAQDIFNNDRNFAEQQRQFNESLALQKQQAAQSAAAASAFSPSLGFGGGSQPSVGNSFVTQRADKGFNFTDANGNPISAAAYAHATGINFRDLLSRMAGAGDQGAKQALGFVGNDYGYDPSKLNSQNLANLYNSLVWGTGKRATYNSTIPIGHVNNPTLSYPGMNTPANGPGSGHPNIYVR